MTHPLLLDLPGFTIEQTVLSTEGITVLAHSQRVRGSCPDCTQLSSRIHSRYQRTLADLPWSGRTVRLVVKVRLFYSKHANCPRKTFAEARNVRKLQLHFRSWKEKMAWIVFSHTTGETGFLLQLRRDIRPHPPGVQIKKSHQCGRARAINWAE
jgi:transposase